MDYETRLQEIRAEIAGACLRVGRDPEDVRIVAVTKYIDTEQTENVVRAGLTDLGENRLQVALPKMEGMAADVQERVRWHYIGNLQTKKVKDVLPRFDWIHSVDRLSLAEEIQKRAAAIGRPIPCLVQVNVSGEESKSGFAPGEVPAFLQAAREMDFVEIRGFMTMAPVSQDPEEARPVFRGLRELRDEMIARGLLPQTSRELSMGMSGDYVVAVEEGATMVRLGSVLVK
ncbi:YggS family pyridoxal phosphate-dependent enzyme [Tumebacillus sp. ITR2]|uniref:Pyridoxal phosphate homeostasis protein n=1 Tax=Tumebacillus amylolyticus TaxID=2801339 RepID=A0ABS1JGQ0_9BACL|nr:YggS family pyridoxal phosphate-dependent enzyme [Tumebacillus amylolyticus]MBL0389467.1 YggS family pyridoxal phosphate-dependent enzyme [Tumebacillus amylolyticus]